MARSLLQVFQGLLAEGHRHLVTPLRGILDHQVVECAQPCRDLIAPLLGGGRSAAVLLLDCMEKCMAKRLGQRSSHFNPHPSSKLVQTQEIQTFLGDP